MGGKWKLTSFSGLARVGKVENFRPFSSKLHYAKYRPDGEFLK